MPGDEKSDIRLLWDTFLKGDEKAFARIYYLHINALLTYGKKLTGDREILYDAVQEVFIDMFQKRQKIQIAINNPKAYLFTALRHAILKKVQAAHRFDPFEVDKGKTEVFLVEYSIEDRIINNELTSETAQKLRAAVDELTPGQKEIIYLKFEEGLGYPEISEMMGITLESARKQLYRALLTLRQIIGNKQFYIFFSHPTKNNH